VTHRGTSNMSRPKRSKSCAQRGSAKGVCACKDLLAYIASPVMLGDGSVKSELTSLKQAIATSWDAIT
jgi:hypothetical protein